MIPVSHVGQGRLQESTRGMRAARRILHEDLVENKAGKLSHEVETFYRGDNQVLSSSLKSAYTLATRFVSPGFAAVATHVR